MWLNFCRDVFTQQIKPCDPEQTCQLSHFASHQLYCLLEVDLSKFGIARAVTNAMIK